MQSKLPDINGAITYHRQQMQQQKMYGNYDQVLIHYMDIVAIMPDEYRLRIDTAEYRRQTTTRLLYRCRACGEDTPNSEIRPYTVRMPLIASLPTLAPASVKVWRCRCRQLTPYDSELLVVHSLSRPYYLQVIPDPPQRTGMERMYVARCKAWLRVAEPELEHQIGAYRTEYSAQQESEELV